MRFIETEFKAVDLAKLLSEFGAVLERVDDKLVTYDFLYQCLSRGSVAACLALPYLVSVSLTRAVDVSEVYRWTFRALSVDALRLRQRCQFLETISQILTSAKLPSSTTTAFAVKLSRLLPLVPPDGQIDVLHLLHVLVSAHECVAKLLEPIDCPVSKTYGDIGECHPQTLWEALALRQSSVPGIGDTARKLGQLQVPPDFGSFDLKAVVESCKAKPISATPRGNWLTGLDRSAWTFRS
jgi:hypothetical protein